MGAVALPFRLLGNPGVVDDALVHFGKHPACRARRLGMIAQKVDMAFDRDRRAVPSLKWVGMPFIRKCGW